MNLSVKGNLCFEKSESTSLTPYSVPVAISPFNSYEKLRGEMSTQKVSAVW